MLEPGITPIDILRMALEKERQAQAFYSELAAEAADPAVKTTLLEMAEEEKGHVRRLEDEIDRFAQPDN